ncbi:MAG: hypothetical protein JWM47_2375 [Acidimicrobiales bacterium]|nr:hypothetical protein [Acidimicrobiales bacterium]
MTENGLPQDEPRAPEVALPPADGRRGRSPRLLVAAVAVVAVVAVGGIWAMAGDDGGGSRKVSAEKGAGSSGGTTSPWGRRWSLRSIEGDGAPELPEPGRTGPLELDLSVEGRVAYNGCNGAAGTGRIERSTLVLDDDGLMSTLVACEGANGKLLMAYDEWMRHLLSSEPTIDMTESTLVVSSAKAKATFGDPRTPPTTTIPSEDPDCPVASPEPSAGPRDEAADTVIPAPGCTPDGPIGGDPGVVPPTLPGPTIVPGPDGGGSPGSPGADDIFGSVWEVTRVEVDGNDRPLYASHIGDPLMLDTANGTRVSFTGCNGGSGEARLDGDRLVVTDIAATRRGCVGAEGEALMAQDVWMAELLESGPTVSIEGDTLTLTTDTTVLTATRPVALPTS